MKTIITIEVESPNRLEVWQDNEISSIEEAFEKLGKEETLKFQDEFSKGVHKEIINYIENIEEKIKDAFELDGLILEDYQIEGWENLGDYDIKIKVTKDTKK